MPKDIYDLSPGYYKTRLRPRGPYVPIKVWWEGEYENGELIQDEALWCLWWPSTDSQEFEVINPLEERGAFMRLNFFEEITEDEFEYLMAMKEL